MKKLAASLIVGYIGGIVGALIFQPFVSVLGILFSDFAIGGIIIGGIMGYKGFDKLPLVKKILYAVLIGLVIFLCFGLLSGELVKDLIAGTFIGLAVALVSHFLSDKVNTMID